MQERTRTQSVCFDRPFKLSANGETYPAGTYQVETVEEPILDLSFVAYRRVSTTMIVSLGNSRQMLTIEPEELAYAIERDRLPLEPAR